jgi:multisubunit Na+/H+ antiporter MnhG subunit
MSLISPPQQPSEKQFGLLFTFVFAVMALLGYIKDWHKPWVNVWVSVAVLVAVVTLVSPKLLAPFNRAWFTLGQLMGRVVSPIVLGVIFFLILTPVALIARVLGRDELRLKRASVDSYWIDRHNDISAAESFKNQF